MRNGILALFALFSAIGWVLMALPADATDTGFHGGMQNARGEARSDVSANSSWSQTEWCPGADPDTLATTLAGRKVIAIQNLSAATCYVTFDAQNPTTDGALGWRFLAGDEKAFDFGDAASVIAACTAATTTGACFQVLQAK